MNDNHTDDSHLKAVNASSMAIQVDLDTEEGLILTHVLAKASLNIFQPMLDNNDNTKRRAIKRQLETVIEEIELLGIRAASALADQKEETGHD